MLICRQIAGDVVHPPKLTSPPPLLGMSGVGLRLCLAFENTRCVRVCRQDHISYPYTMREIRENGWNPIVCCCVGNVYGIPEGIRLINEIRGMTNVAGKLPNCVLREE